jgi:hypothetical protein
LNARRSVRSGPISSLTAVRKGAFFGAISGDDFSNPATFKFIDESIY